MPLLALLALTSCNDYLDTKPSKGSNEQLGSSEQVEALFNNSELFMQATSTVVGSSDDNGITNDMYDALGYLGSDLINGIDFAIDDLENSQYGDAVWEGAYSKIFTANLVINEIDQVTDASEEQKNEYLAQAHFLRAVSMWELAQTFCQPYSASTLDTPGLPLRQANDYEEDVSRASLADTYAFILADLQEALKTNKTDVDKRWLVSKPAVEAMLARYYLFTGDYAQAESYAKQAMQSNNVTLEDYNDYTREPALLMDPNTSEQDTVYYSQLWNYSPNEVTTYAENFYTAYYDIQSGTYLIPSESLMSIYDQDNDLRFQQFFNKHALWGSFISGFGDDIQYHRMQNQYSDDLLPMGPTMPEMILTAAEAEARQGKVSEAMTTVNRLREARMRRGADDVYLTASTQQEAVEKILEERHREMPFIARWQDIRRLAYNDVDYDDVVVSHTFYNVENNNVDLSTVYTYTLPVKSLRYAQPISNLEIKRSNGQIVQNTYSGNDVIKTVVDTGGDDEGEGGDDEGEGEYYEGDGEYAE